MKIAGLVRIINPSELIWTNTVRTVATVVRKANSPVVVTFADIISHTSSMAAAIVVASSICERHDGR
jgi:p-aminobenzoyl-glutamate transporter AbgT